MDDELDVEVTGAPLPPQLPLWTEMLFSVTRHSKVVIPPSHNSGPTTVARSTLRSACALKMLSTRNTADTRLQHCAAAAPLPCGLWRTPCTAVMSDAVQPLCEHVHKLAAMPPPLISSLRRWHAQTKVALQQCTPAGTGCTLQAEASWWYERQGRQPSIRTDAQLSACRLMCASVVLHARCSGSRHTRVAGCLWAVPVLHCSSVARTQAAADTSSTPWRAASERRLRGAARGKVKRRKTNNKKKVRKFDAPAANTTFAILLEESGLYDDNAEEPNYLTAAVGPSSCSVARKFCSVCGNFSKYTCVRCGSLYCCKRCFTTHSETRCLKFAL